jgi:hypothetical protein
VRALLLLALAACGTGSAYRTTRIAPAGHTEYLFGAQVSGAGTVGAPTEGSGGVAPLPELAVAARRGFDDRYEAQLNTTLLSVGPAHTGSVELAGKVRFYEHERWSLAAGASAGYRIAEAGGAIIEGAFVSAPLIGAVELGRHQLVLSLDAGFQRLYSSGARPVDIPYAGASIGFVWQIARTWALLPEAGADLSPTGNFMTEHSRLFHVGLAALWTH